MDEILDLIESVSEVFLPTLIQLMYRYKRTKFLAKQVADNPFKQ